MTYFSLKNREHLVNFETALLRGLAPDGGLYFPNEIPRFSQNEIEDLLNLDLPTVGSVILSKWLEEDIPTVELKNICQEALSFPIPVKQVGNQKILELFHGPTMAFKDIAAGLLARFVGYFAGKTNNTVNVLVATSGDTGGAIAHGFANVQNTQVFVLFPKGKVSQLQHEQLTRVASNIFPIEVVGNFDDCQALVKRAFNDPLLAGLNLTSANSINIGRLLPQIIYHFWALQQLDFKKNAQIVVPSGNFGNLAAGFFARAMGLDVHGFVAAVNDNDTVPRFLETGQYEPHSAVSTLSTAMDIADPSNFVRILEFVGGSQVDAKNHLRAWRVSDAETIETIKDVYQNHGYLLCPHTAVGWVASKEFASPGVDNLIYATASPLKFAEEIEAATGISADNSKELEKLRQVNSRKVLIENDYSDLKRVLSESA